MKSNTEWIGWGKQDPLFGVAAWPEHEQTGRQPWTDADFYELGRSDWEDFIAYWDRYGRDPAYCLEIGCGAGRLTKHIAASVGQLVAVDVSSEMISYAASHIDATNVAFHETDGRTLPVEEASVTGVFSAHVFQHFDSPEDAAGYFAEIFRVLASNGSVMIHLPLHAAPIGSANFGRFMKSFFRAKKAIGNVKASLQRTRIRSGQHVPLMRGLSYEIDWVVATLQSIGFREVEFSIFPVKSNGSYHPFVFARR